MPRIPRRKGRRDCSLVIVEAGIVVPHHQPSYIYRSGTDKPLLVDRKFMLILHKHFGNSLSFAFISAVLK